MQKEGALLSGGRQYDAPQPFRHKLKPFVRIKGRALGHVPVLRRNRQTG
jgi:hypothetical protein